jgi:hypothetical protein
VFIVGIIFFLTKFRGVYDSVWDSGEGEEEDRLLENVTRRSREQAKSIEFEIQKDSISSFSYEAAN